jgi:tetratricopeptide (TPR) repeat protein
MQRQLNDDPVRLARILNALAITLHEQDRAEEALLSYQRAFAELEATTNELDKSRIILSTGALYFKLGQFEKARDAFVRADTEAFWQSGDLFAQATLLQNLGNVWTKLKQFDKARHYLHRSQRIWKQLGEKVLLANTLAIIGEGLAAQGTWQQALDYYDEALLLLAQFSKNSQAKRLLIEFTQEREAILRQFAT